ncbi:hypothetical protein [Cupriavidus plantarum]|uniref:Uncharacterized protein n=1 Tax=Cupriavidus plantarum TaxID=942865 RepID=A0A316F1E5_9BURK|nr:hypothetical protein [Cupriavidus plantarum]NYH98435.1 hypothetical protein [Cupriavidus plantarum]PWK37935.1 hypothetical protein C7419_1011822 [Cupriavidus plantarum]REF01366.1 hypothetical protein C7418_0143 [Cupriavidus plantarum]RLK45775.1 hypothetical protein C7417_1799 [Cupriavidus plantarum]CAG2127872.1 hypothetical protein LMG26296_00916 [Cupriavidus plantarum]
MAYRSEWKKRVFETHEVQVLVKPRSENGWEYTVRVCRAGTNIRAAATLTESSAITDRFRTPEEAEAAGFERGKAMFARM